MSKPVVHISLRGNKDCGIQGNMYVNAWEYVTCKRCLKLRPDAGKEKKL